MLSGGEYGCFKKGRREDKVEMARNSASAIYLVAE